MKNINYEAVQEERRVGWSGEGSGTGEEKAGFLRAGEIAGIREEVQRAKSAQI